MGDGMAGAFRFKKSIIKTNLVFSLSFGIFMGILFPFYASLFVDFRSDLLLGFFIAGCIAAGIAVGTIAFLITRFTIVKVIRLISNELANIASGQGDLTQRIDIRSDDELGALIDWFNIFIEKIDTMIRTTKQNISAARTGSGDLAQNVEKTVNAMNSITKSIDSINSISHEHDTVVLSTEEALKGLDKTVLVILTYILELFSQMDFLTNIILSQAESVNKMFLNIERLAHKIGEINSKAVEASTEAREISLTHTSMGLMKETESAFSRSGENVRKIGEILTMISDVYSKTSILSINASIEAARRSSAGSGFKIIASEIRGLARNAETMTTDIGRILDEVTNGISLSVKNLDRSKEQFTGIVSGIKETSRELLGDVENIQKITGDVEQNYSRIREMLLSVKNNMEKLKQTSACFSESMGNLNRLSAVIKQGVAEIHSGSHEIDKITENTLRVAEKLKLTCNSIDEQVSQYTTSGDKHEKNR